MDILLSPKRVLALEGPGCFRKGAPRAGPMTVGGGDPARPENPCARGPAIPAP
jgi:hypothetical protein